MIYSGLVHNGCVTLVLVIVLSFFVVPLRKFSFCIVVPCFIVLILYAGCVLSARWLGWCGIHFRPWAPKTWGLILLLFKVSSRTYWNHLHSLMYSLFYPHVVIQLCMWHCVVLWRLKSLPWILSFNVGVWLHPEGYPRSRCSEGVWFLCWTSSFRYIWWWFHR